MSKLNRRDAMKGVLAAGLMLPYTRLSAQERAAIEEAAKKEGQVALATSVSVPDFPKFLAAFTKRYPFLDVNTGLYQAPTGTVLARVDAEMKAGALTFDVLHIANQAAYIGYARDGRLLPYASPERTGYPPSAYDGDNWTTVRAVGVMLAYNKNILTADKAPKSWADLLKPEFAGKKLVIQNAAAGTWLVGIYMLHKTFGPDYLKKLAAQNCVVVTTAAQQLDMLNRGEALVGVGIDHTVLFTDTTQKAGIVPIYPADGTPVAATPVAILKNAPHPNAAKLMIDYMLSKEGQEIFIQQVMRNYSLRPDITPAQGQTPLAQVKTLTPTDYPDYEKFVQGYPDYFNSLFKPS